MRPNLLLSVILEITFFISHQAKGACIKLPREVSAYLKHRQGWSIVEFKSLTSEDRQLWDQYHSGECPGFAKFNPDGSGLPSYALALVRQEGNKVLEEAVVVRSCACAVAVLSEAMNVKTTDVPAISVIWRAPPARFTDVISGRTIKVLHDGVVYERIGSGALLYYLYKGHFRQIQTAD